MFLSLCCVLVEGESQGGSHSKTCGGLTNRCGLDCL